MSCIMMSSIFSCEFASCEWDGIRGARVHLSSVGARVDYFLLLIALHIAYTGTRDTIIDCGI
jgi:hypothetical protein